MVLALVLGILLTHYLPFFEVAWAVLALAAPVLVGCALRWRRTGAATGLVAALGLWVLLGAANSY